jgi:hypothetical protein
MQIGFLTTTGKLSSSLSLISYFALQQTNFLSQRFPSSLPSRLPTNVPSLLPRVELVLQDSWRGNTMMGVLNTRVAEDEKECEKGIEPGEFCGKGVSHSVKATTSTALPPSPSVSNSAFAQTQAGVSPPPSKHTATTLLSTATSNKPENEKRDDEQ